MDQQSTQSASRELKDKSLPELMINLYGDVTDLVHAEVALVKAEVAEKASLAGQGAGLISGSIFALIMAVGCATALVIIALAILLPSWLAAFIVTLLWLLTAAVLAFTGKGRFKQI